MSDKNLERNLIYVINSAYGESDKRGMFVFFLEYKRYPGGRYRAVVEEIRRDGKKGGQRFEISEGYLYRLGE